MDLTGTDWCGNGAPPMTNRKVYVEQPRDQTTYVFSRIDDGGWVGVGHPDSWHTVSIRPKAFRMAAWWALRMWVVDWFGLRSAIYYRALHAKVRGKWQRQGTPERKLARRSSHEQWRVSP